MYEIPKTLNGRRIDAKRGNEKKTKSPRKKHVGFNNIWRKSHEIVEKEKDSQTKLTPMSEPQDRCTCSYTLPLQRQGNNRLCHKNISALEITLANKDDSFSRLKGLYQLKMVSLKLSKMYVLLLETLFPFVEFH